MGTPITGTTKLLGLVAYPAKQSMSPAMHNASFRSLGTDARYLAFEVSPEGLGEAVAGLASLGAVGYNVGVPHKQAILPHLDELSEGAKLMQSVNCVQIREGRSIGHNTDGLSFTQTLKDAGLGPKGTSIAILDIGAEGPAYTVQAALEGAEHILVIVEDGRKEEATQRIWRLRAVSQTTIDVIELGEAKSDAGLLQGFTVLCNATRIGTGDSEGESPLPQALLHEGLTVIETIYAPRETQLMKDAKAAGAKTIDGLVPLLNQSAVAERLWLGIDMPKAEIAERFFA